MKKQSYKAKASTKLNVGTMVQGMIGENTEIHILLIEININGDGQKIFINYQ